MTACENNTSHVLSGTAISLHSVERLRAPLSSCSILHGRPFITDPGKSRCIASSFGVAPCLRSYSENAGYYLRSTTLSRARTVVT